MGNHRNAVSAPARTSRLEPLLDVAAAADYLGVSRRQVYLLLERRELPVVRVGHRIRFIPDELREYVERNREVP